MEEVSAMSAKVAARLPKSHIFMVYQQVELPEATSRKAAAKSMRVSMKVSPVKAELTLTQAAQY
jgi:hypothetical protein